MTKAEVIIFIRAWIYANGANLITADILRPILEEMLLQPNNLIGELSTLNTTSKNTLVAAINEIVAGAGTGGLKVLVGTADPNVTPPSFVVGDFYRRLELTGETTSVQIGYYVNSGRTPNPWLLISDSNADFNVLVGTADPNITAPTNGSVGNFYRWVSATTGSQIGFYVHSGKTPNAWIKIQDPVTPTPTENQNLVGKITFFNSNYTVLTGDITLIYYGTTAGHVLTIPQPNNVIGRILKIVNSGSNNINLSQTFVTPAGIATNVVEQGRVVEIQSWTDWRRINN